MKVFFVSIFTLGTSIATAHAQGAPWCLQSGRGKEAMVAMTKSEFEFAAGQIDAFKERLSKEHFTILKAAAASWSTRTIATNL
jgi:hypothetical protein